MGRDDFSQKTIRTVALRAGYLCSNPDCRRPTSGPHSDPEKAIITGEAAHIHAAAENGPRYNPDHTSDERKSIKNAIWLCGDCNKRFDTDWVAWPVEKLLDMKSAHERWIAAEAMIPSMPEIMLTTRSGLRFHERLPEITSELQARLREHDLTIRNPNRVELFNLKLTLNLPEVIVLSGHTEIPLGIIAGMRPLQPANTVIMRGNARAVQGPRIPTMYHEIEADKLGAGSKIATAFYTEKPDQTMPYDLFRLNPGGDWADPEKMEEHKECHFYLEGTYQFLLRNEYVIGNLFVPLLFNAEPRTITSYPVQGTSEPWKVWEGILSRGATLQVGGAAQS